MAILGTYIFKPKHDIGLTRKIIEKFTFNWLAWEECGAYLSWNCDRMSKEELPAGYVKFDVEMDSGSLEDFTETCWQEDIVSSANLTDDMFVLLVDEGFFYSSHDDDPENYHFYERELTEVLAALSADDSRLLSFWGDQCWICQKAKDGSTHYKQKKLAQMMLDAAF